MDKIWDRKSLQVGGHWPLWRGWKKRMTTQNRQKSNAKKIIFFIVELIFVISVFLYTLYKVLVYYWDADITVSVSSQFSPLSFFSLLLSQTVDFVWISACINDVTVNNVKEQIHCCCRNLLICQNCKPWCNTCNTCVAIKCCMVLEQLWKREPHLERAYNKLCQRCLSLRSWLAGTKSCWSRKKY